MIESTMGQRVKALRTLQGITQSEFAEMINVSNTYLSYIEKDNKIPSIKILTRMVKTLNTSFDYLLLGVLKDDSDNDIRAILEQALKLPKTKLDRYIKIITALLENIDDWA